MRPGGSPSHRQPAQPGGGGPQRHDHDRAHDEQRELDRLRVPAGHEQAARPLEQVRGGVVRRHRPEPAGADDVARQVQGREEEKEEKKNKRRGGRGGGPRPPPPAGGGGGGAMPTAASATASKTAKAISA